MSSAAITIICLIPFVSAEGLQVAPTASTPHWQRKLSAGDAKKAANLQQSMFQFFGQRKFPEAIETAKTIVRLRSDAQGADHWQVTNARQQLELLQRLAEMPEAQRRFCESIPQLERNADLLERKGQYRKAEEYRRQALAAYRKTLGARSTRTAASHSNLALNLDHQRKYQEAEEHYRKSLAMLKKQVGEQHPETAQVYGNLAGNLHEQGRSEESVRLFHKALAISRFTQGENHRATAEFYFNLGRAFDALGKYADAQQCARTVLAIDRQIYGENHANTALAYNNLALILDRQGHQVKAEPLYRRALKILLITVGENHRQTAIGTHNLATNLMEQNKFAVADALYRKALLIFEGKAGGQNVQMAICNNALALNLTRWGKHKKAEEGFRSALRIYRDVLGDNNPKIAACYNNFAASLDQQARFSESEQLHRKALAIRRRHLHRHHPDIRESLHNLGANLMDQGKNAEAEKNLSEAADVFLLNRRDAARSELGRASYAAQKSPLRRLAIVLARNNKAIIAWKRLEEGLGRATWDELAARRRRSPEEQNQLDKLAGELRRLDRLIESSGIKPAPEKAKLRKEWLAKRRSVQKSLDSLQRRLQKKYGGAVTSVSLQQIQAALPPDAALLAWVDMPDRQGGEHWAVVLRAGGPPVWQSLPGNGAKQDWTKADILLASLVLGALVHPPQPGGGDWQGLLTRLAKQRIDPIRKHFAATDRLPAVRHIIALPSTMMDRIPADLLVDGVNVTYAPSAGMLAMLLQQQKRKSSGVLALGDPDFRPVQNTYDDQGKSQWNPLPGTRVETSRIRQLFSAAGQTAQLLADSDASEQRISQMAESGKLTDFRYLHLATHGEVNHRIPLQSALILAQDQLPNPLQQLNLGKPVYDGRLTAEEILRNWRLQAELVTLSACESGLGKHESGEGFMGFSQSLLLAGSRSVVLSLWKVDDTATALLMDRFYENLLGLRKDIKPMAKAKALAEAKKWLRTLPRSEVLKHAAKITNGVARGKGRKDQPLLRAVPKSRQPAIADTPPFAHPYFWAAFILIGDPR